MQKPEILSARSDYQTCAALPRIQRETLLDFSSYRVQLSILYLAKIKLIYKKKKTVLKVFSMGLTVLFMLLFKSP